MTPEETASYTVGELERETGFDRRTIAYYVQEELLPRVGRRGPRTRYPRLVRDRLLFIRSVREAEEAGRVSPVTLSDFRKIFERVAPSLIAGVANGRIAVTPELVEEASTAFRLPEMRSAGMRRASLRRRMESRLAEDDSPRVYGMPARGPRKEGVAYSPTGPREDPDDEVGEPVEGSPSPPVLDVSREAPPRVGSGQVYSRRSRPPEALLADALAKLHRRARRRRKRDDDAMDTWTRIDVTRDIALSVRGLDEDDRKLAERVRKAMRRILGKGRGGRKRD